MFEKQSILNKIIGVLTEKLNSLEPKPALIESGKGYSRDGWEALIVAFSSPILPSMRTTPISGSDHNQEEQ
jgi:hypothetical protein